MFSVFSKSLRLSVIVLSVFTLAILAGCKEDSVSSHEDHFDAQGIYISSGGIKVIDYYGPDITTGTNTVLGPVPILVGENGHWDVQFYNSKKEIVDGPADEADHFMVVELKDSTVATVDDEHKELRDNPTLVDGWYQYRFNSGVYDFHLVGIKSGAETNLRLKVFHVDHADFTSLQVKVKVGE